MRPIAALKVVFLLLVSLEGTTMAISHAQKSSTSPADILAQSRSKYAALKSYSDTGTVTVEYKGPDDPAAPTADHHTFSTYYRSPRQFIFDFAKDPTVSDEHYVVWVDGGDFSSWWSATKVRDDYPKGQGGNAFALGTFPTKGSIMQISPLLFAEGGLHGPLTDFKALKADEFEDVNKHRCHKLVGEVGLAYGTGAVTGVTPTTIWIDAESLLVRKVFEDTPKNTPGVSRTTTTFEPVADPKIDDAKFKFTPPK